MTARGSAGRPTGGTADWRRVDYDFTATGNAPPKYMAVWLQGPGTVWVDDMSLREVLADRDAVRVTLDADEYYRSERAALVTVAIDAPDARPESLSLAVQVLSARGEEGYAKVEHVRGTRFHVRVPLAKLSRGAHELVARLVDGNGGDLGESRARFVYSDGAFAR